MARVLKAGSQLLRTGGVAFSPTDLPNLALWLDATKITGVSNGAALTTWNDSSGLGRNAGSGVNATYRTNVQNGLPVVRYAAGYHTIAASTAMFNALHYSGGTVFAVASFGTTADPNAAYAVIGNNRGATNTPGYLLLWNDQGPTSNNRVASYVSSQPSTYVANNVSANNALAAQTWGVISDVLKPTDATAANRSTIRVNGGAAIANNTAAQTALNNNASYNMQIGAEGTNDLRATADFAELIIYAAPLSDADRQRVERYLGTKWGIAVA